MGVFPSNTPVVLNDRGDLTQIAPDILFGIGFLGDRFSEEVLIGVVYAFEQRTNARGPLKPYVLRETELWDVVGRHGESGHELEL